jgi:hypothetical protein
MNGFQDNNAVPAAETEEQLLPSNELGAGTPSNGTASVHEQGRSFDQWYTHHFAVDTEVCYRMP